MRTTLSIATTAALVLLLGCAPGQMMNGNGNGQWQTNLLPEAGFVGLEGQAEVTALEWGATATARVSGAPEEGSHAWHIHRGECGDDGEIVGAEEAYPPLEVDQDGSGEATAMIEQSLDPDEDYYVDIHPSRTDTETVIACGDLMSTGAAPQPDEWN